MQNTECALMRHQTFYSNTIALYRFFRTSHHTIATTEADTMDTTAEVTGSEEPLLTAVILLADKQPDEVCSPLIDLFTTTTVTKSPGGTSQ